MVRTVAPALLLALSLAGVGSVCAQSGPTSSTTPTTQAGLTPLGEDDLADYLRKIDPDVKPERVENGGSPYTRFVVKLTRDGWNYVVQVQVFRDRIFLVSELGKPLTNFQGVTAEALQKLHEMNWKIHPTTIALSRLKDGSVQMYGVHPMVRTLDTTRFGIEFNEFLTDLKDSYPAWNAVLSAAK
jgi:hypothetical protein